MRLFVGTLLSAANQDALGGFTTAIVSLHRDALRRVPDGTIHMTHVFCGEVPEEMLPPVCAAVSAAARVHVAFDIAVGAPHVIFGGSRPRLLVGSIVRGADEVAALTRAIADAIAKQCPRLALSPSRSPHVTLGRFRKQSRRSDGRSVMQTIESGKVAFPTSTDRIERIEVIESTLASTGPEYRIRYRIDLG